MLRRKYDESGSSIESDRVPEKLSAKIVIILCSILDKYIDRLEIIANLKREEEADHDIENQEIWNSVVRTLLILKEELTNDGTYDILEEILKHEQAPKRHQKHDTLESLELEVQQLEHQLNETVSTFQEELSTLDDTILRQSDELQKLAHDNESSLQFEKTWLQVQLEEDNLRYELREKELTREIVRLESDIAEEEQVHSQITWYYENEMETVEGLIRYWRDRFRDIEKRKEDLKVLSAKQEKLHEELEVNRKQYETRQGQMDEYLADKERRRKEYEYEQFLHTEATKIQAWWRGVMVRRFIGPFRYLLKVKSNRRRKMSLKRNKK